nr:isochorismatase family cysteine hydrolase [Luteimonas sp. MC1750]
MLVIDMIGLLDFPGADRVAPSALRAARGVRTLRDRFHRRGWPVAYVNDNFARWQSDFRELVAMASASPGPAQAIAGLLEPTPKDYFVLKPKHSAFLDTALSVLLAKLGVRRLLLAGMALESCVLATAIDANAREYEVAVVREAVAGQPPLRAAAFKVLAGSKAADVVALDRAVAWAARPARRARPGGVAR